MSIQKPQTTNAPVVTEQSPTPVFTKLQHVPTPQVTQAPVVVSTAPPPEVTLEPLQATVEQPQPLNQQQATEVTLDSIIESINQSGNSPAKFVVAGLQRYITSMKPGLPLEQKEAASNQTALWKTLYNFLENAEEDFDKVYSVILGLFFKHKDGVFHEHYVFRAMSDVALDAEEIQAFQVLINLIKVTADPVGRQAALKQNVDISRTLANVFSETARQKVLSFYGM